MSQGDRPALVGDVAGLRKIVARWRGEGARVALVPTMGALHAGHISLIDRARQEADQVVVSIFVNPTQFSPSEDFSKYPRMFEADLQKLREVATDLCFAPDIREMYPENFATTVLVDGVAKADLEDRFRPTHFAGVATIVAKLLIQAQADVALFGEKDYQQLLVVKRMAADLDIPTRIVGAPNSARGRRVGDVIAQRLSLARRTHPRHGALSGAVRRGGADKSRRGRYRCNESGERSGGARRFRN